MTKDDARSILQENKSLRFESWSWDRWQYTCSTTDEGEYECCREDFNNIDEALEHLECECGGDWSEVF